MKTDADGRYTSFGYYGYDASRRPTTMSFDTDPWIYYTYDSLGNLTTVKDSTGTFTTDYDALNRVVTKRTQAGNVYYQYDRSSLKTYLGDTDGYYSYDAYDAAGRLASVTLLDAPARAGYFFYDASGMVLTRLNPGSRIFSYYTYDNAGRLATLNNWAPVAAQTVSSFNYVRDPNGNISYFVREDGGTTYYGYDALDRLIKDERRDNLNAIQYGFLYNYDAASNRYFKYDEVQNTTAYYTYNANNLLSQELDLP